jgi:hypothetical protein
MTGIKVLWIAGKDKALYEQDRRPGISNQVPGSVFVLKRQCFALGGEKVSKKKVTFYIFQACI